jgi:hypothetical protein
MFSIQEKYIHENEGEQIQNDTPINKSNLEIEINLPTGSPKGASCSESKKRRLQICFIFNIVFMGSLFLLNSPMSFRN